LVFIWALGTLLKGHIPSSATAMLPALEKSAMINAQKNCLSFMISPSKEGSQQVRQPQRKNEGESLHIGSPSTIPLTLGEEMAVLLLPESLYQIWQRTRQLE